MSNAGTSHALEVKAKWAALLTSGAKTVELRAYQLPEDLLNKPLLLLATPDGQEGVSGLADDVPAGCSSAQVVGEVTFVACKRYSSEAEWEADIAAHCVEPGSVYGWQLGMQCLYGWVVGNVAAMETSAPMPALRRRHRSIFEVL